MTWCEGLPVLAAAGLEAGYSSMTPQDELDVLELGDRVYDAQLFEQVATTYSSRANRERSMCRLLLGRSLEGRS